MGQKDRGVEIATGRRGADGHVRLSLFTNDLLALTLTDLSERAPTLLLTRAQVVELQRALAQFAPLLTEAPEATERRGGGERRAGDELK
jgi:hypothetical protein